MHVPDSHDRAISMAKFYASTCVCEQVADFKTLVILLDYLHLMATDSDSEHQPVTR